MTIHMPAKRIFSMVIPENPPIKNAVRAKTVSGFKVNKVSVMAPIKLDTATPDKTMVVLEAPVFRAIKYTENTAKRAPAKAAGVARCKDAGKKAAISTVNNPAPELTPITFGLARELFNTDCNTAPETDRAHPARTAAKVRGMRKT